MKLPKSVFILILLLGICAAFFYKTLLYGYIPFPGDLLIAEYAPWKSYSYLGYNPGSFPHKAQYFDVLRQMYPWKTLVTTLLKTGQLPLWNPYNFSGAPLLANFQSAVFYPFNIIYLWFPQTAAWTISAFLQPLLAALFTYFYARKIGISIVGGLFASLSFAFSSFMIVWIEYNTIGHVVLWLPLILLASERLLDTTSIRWYIVFIFALVASLFAGHVQIFAYLLLFIITYAMWRFREKHALKDWKKNTHKLLTLGVMVLLALGIGAVQLLPGIELLRESARVSHAYDFLINKILIQPWQLVMFIIPDFFGNPATHNYWPNDTYIGKMISIGIIPLFFMLVLRKVKEPLVKFFVTASIVIIIAVTRNPITMVLYATPLPVLSASAPTLSVFLLVFSLSILAGFGVDVWRKFIFSRKQYVRIIAPIFALFIFLWIGVFFMHTSQAFSTYAGIAFRNLLYGTVVALSTLVSLFLGTQIRQIKNSIFILLFLLHVFTLWRSFDKFNPFVPEQLVFPNTEVLTFLKETAGIDRFWGYGGASVDANFATQYSLYSPDGYDPLYPRWYGAFIHSSRDGKLFTNFSKETRSDAIVVRGFGKENFMNNPYRLRVIDILGVRYVLDRQENGATQETFPSERFRLLYEKDGWKIYENKKALPRVFLATDYKVFGREEEFGKIFFSQDFDLSKTILLERDYGKLVTNSDQFRGNVVVKEYKTNNIVFATNAPGNRILFLSDTYYPGWKAFVDGKETKIYRANYAFRAVAIPQGSHAVTFTFSSSSVKIGSLISIGSFFVLIFLLIFLNRRGYRLYNTKR